MLIHDSRRIPTFIVAGLLALALSGCMNLEGVGKFAKESSDVARFSEGVQRYQGTYRRIEPWLIQLEQRDKAKADEDRRSQGYQQLGSLNEAAAAYFSTLGRLTGSDAFRIDTNLEKLAANLKSAQIGIDPKTVDAGFQITKIVANWLTAAAQERAVRNMVEEGHQPMQTLIAGMEDIVRLMIRSHENERSLVVGGLENRILAESARDPDSLAISIARDLLPAKRADYEKGAKTYQAIAAGLETIRKGDDALYVHRNEMHLDMLKAKLSELTHSLQSLKGAISTLQH